LAIVSKPNKKKRPEKEVIGRRRFGKSICFLCGRQMRDPNYTDEHVFPKWLQNRFQLWNQNIILLNGTTIRYRQLKVPCCQSCNNDHLSGIENRMVAAIEKGPHAVRSMPEIDIYLWIGKIFFGILYKEYLLTHDRGKPRSKLIISRKFLGNFDLQHVYLQAARVPIKFQGRPGSVFVFELQVHRDYKYQFNYWDSLHMVATCRIGNVGIMAVFEDGGIIKDSLEPVFSEYYSIALHPLQFDELAARLLYSVIRLQRTAKSITIESPSGEVISITRSPGFSLKPWFRPWVIEDYARVLGYMLKLPLELVFHPPDELYTLLKNEKGAFNKMDVNDGNWP
jgi:hypothetical protein